jgi:hypothetical protein
VRLRRYRVLLWCLGFSLIFHFTVVPELVGLLWGRHVERPIEVTLAKVSSLEITHRAHPHPHRTQQKVTQRAVAVNAVPKTVAAAAPPQAAPRREVARISPRGRISLPHLSPQLDVSTQQAQYEKTIAQLREQSNPVADAARPLATIEPAKHYAFNFSASVGTAPDAYGVLTPVKKWRDGPYNYYYVQYYVQYADGTSETGYVPWPLRYVPEADPFAHHWEHFPLPAPLADFRLPADTNLHPLVAFCYEHRSELTNCPIMHD